MLLLLFSFFLFFFFFFSSRRRHTRFDCDWSSDVCSSDLRWIPRPSVGPHAHDCIRWIRIGLCSPEKSDRWWSYGADSGGLEPAMLSLAEHLSGSGVQWIDRQSEPPNFIEYAREQMERSRSDRHPDGGFVELRLMAAVLAWHGDRDQALKFANRARAIWSEEKERLTKARQLYQKKQDRKSTRLNS